MKQKMNDKLRLKLNIHKLKIILIYSMTEAKNKKNELIKFRYKNVRRWPLITKETDNMILELLIINQQNPG